MRAARGTAPLNQAQRIRKREVDRQSQQRIRERRNAALYEAERKIELLCADLDRSSTELRQARQYASRLEEENRALQEKLERATSNAEHDRGTKGAGEASVNLPPISSVMGGSQTLSPSMHRALAPFPFHSMAPRNDKFDCLSDDILSNFLKTCRLDTIPPALPDLTPLLAPETDCVPKPGSVQSLAKILTDLTQRLPSFPSLPEQIANHYVLYKMSVWRLACKEGVDAKKMYEAMPEWLRPLPIQMIVNHAPWMDHIPWPAVRSHLIDNQAMYNFDSFSTLYTSAFSVNWPYGHETTVLSSWNSETSKQEVSMNPAFERHLCDLSNWSINGAAFQKQFPTLSDLANEHRRDVPETI